MRKETIYNPYAGEEIFEAGDKSPRFSHFTVENSDPLNFSPNPIIQKLIESGWTVETTFTQFFWGFPTNSFKLRGHFVVKERHEFEIRAPVGCFIRFRFEEPDSIYLTLFQVDYEKQGQGIGRIWFPRIVDCLFRAGVQYMRGEVAQSMYRCKWPVNVPRLTRFYVRNGFKMLGGGYIGKTSPYATKETDSVPGITSVQASPNSEAIETRNASEMATIS